MFHKAWTHLVKEVNNHRNKLGVDDSLHLLLVSCCYVGQKPYCLLQDKVLLSFHSDGQDSTIKLTLHWIRTERHVKCDL